MSILDLAIISMRRRERADYFASLVFFLQCLCLEFFCFVVVSSFMSLLSYVCVWGIFGYDSKIKLCMSILDLAIMLLRKREPASRL